MSHTPGPWEVFDGDEDGDDFGASVKSWYEDLSCYFDVAECSRIDDARLIAAAPELLELMKELRNAEYGLRTLSQLSESACQRVIEDTWYPKIDAVIAKAEAQE